jgi:glycerol-3-phosphate dehydrogenase
MPASNDARYPNLAVEFGDRTFDLLVIGGGITGCGVARDAAMRGLTVALIERDDLASGTSSRSSRLIHGGIRYLEHGQLHLVHESIREREVLLRIAPHLVKPLAFTWPLYRGARIGKIKLGAGLLAYQLLAGGRSRRHSMLDAAETMEREPALKRTGLTGGAVYYDACTDDARLTVATAIAARDHGAVIRTHATVVNLLVDGSRAVGGLVKPKFGEESYEVKARTIVNATGIWENQFGFPGAPKGRGTKGVHIAVPRERVGNRYALTLISPIDGRVMFCLPADQQAIIGTTDTWTSESPETVHASLSDVDYLIDSANAYFDRADLERDDVVSAWAGIRPLANATTANAGAVSREHTIVSDGRGVITVTGGKLTTYRAMAAEIVDRVQQSLGQRRVDSRTDSTELPGADRDQSLTRLQTEKPELATPVIQGLSYTNAHLVYGIQTEMAQTLSDLLIRRTHIAFETADHGASVATAAADVVAPYLGWTQETKRARVQEYQLDIERMFAIS